VLRRTIAAAILPALLLAACGDDTQDTSTSVDHTPTTAATSADSDVQQEIEDRGKPTVTVPDAPATELVITDDIEGTGPEVAPGDTVTVHYVGVGQASGQQFDSSWDRGEPITFSLDEVIQGWTEGLVGMKVGGRRTLIVPGEMAYGDNPRSSDIAPGETLVFTIDLIAIS
jgi:peptidylprolyl isomerase